MKKLLIAFAAVFLICIAFYGLRIHQPTVPSYNIFEINNDRYCVPKQYAHLLAKNSNDPPIYIQAIGPELEPLEKPPQAYESDDQWWQEMRILVDTEEKVIPIEEFREKVKTSWYATQFVADEYGLRHFTQPEDQNQDAFDYWIEEDDEENVFTIISCTEKHSESSVPQCNLFFFNDGLNFKISADKRLLPKWRTIKNNSTKLIKNFECGFEKNKKDKK